MRLLVCGSRDWSDAATLCRVLDGLLFDIEDNWNESPSIVQGGARGADLLARAWAEQRGLEVEEYPADWDNLGRRAGYVRNSEMLASGVDGVAAFSTARPATRGTAHMCRLSLDAGVPVCFVGPDGVERWYYPE